MPKISVQDHCVASDGDLLERGTQIMKQLDIYQKEEELITSELILHSISNLHSTTESNIKQSITSLNAINLSTSQKDIIEQIGTLRQTVEDLSNRTITGFTKQRQLEGMFEEDVVKFSPLGWSNEKLKALLPNVFEQGHQKGTFQEMELHLKEKEMVIGKLNDLKLHVTKYLEELNEFGSRGDLLLLEHGNELSKTLEEKKERFRLIHTFDKGTKSEVIYLKAKLIDLSLLIGNFATLHSEYMSSAKIIDSFEKSLNDYIRYREFGLVELNVKNWTTTYQNNCIA